jgi:NAD(P)-dependent dehydrogenase (short-subunit alcohol dehydrogenase family)
MNIEGKVAVVTGATGGLGWQICRALAREKAKLVLVYLRSADKAERYAAQLRETGCEAAAIQADITTAEGIDRVLSGAVETFGGVDILVLDAAYNEFIPFGDLETLDEAKWNYILNYNLTSPYLAVRKAAPLLRANGGGRIVMISSNAGLHPYGSSIAYSVSKSALIHLGKCLSVSLAPDILVNTVSPGLMEGTRMTERLDPAMADNVRAAALLGRAADKDDVAAAVLLFCETDSITGQTLVADSGRVFH